MFEYISGESQFPSFDLTISHVKRKVQFQILFSQLQKQL